MNLQNLDFTPLWITMKTGVAATFVSFFLGIFAARFVMGRKGKARAFWDGFLTMPLVLQHTSGKSKKGGIITMKKGLIAPHIPFSQLP